MHTTRRTPVGLAFRATESLAALGAAVSAAELLTVRHVLDDGGPLGWPAARTRNRWMTGPAAGLLDRVFGAAGARAIVAGRLVAAGCLLGARRPALRAACSGYLAASHHAMSVRTPYGTDGSETMLMVVSAATCLGRLSGGGERAELLALRFVAAQSLLSYSVAGIAKLRSSVWFDGTAVRDVVRTRLFGHRRVFEELRYRPRTALVLSRSVTIAELAFPLAAVGPLRLRVAAVTAMALFHLVNAGVMGLNRFVWAFLASYPAVLVGVRGEWR